MRFPLKLTAIVYVREGVVLSVRTHAGFKSTTEVGEYLSHLDPCRIDDVCQFWPIEQYEDVGDMPKGERCDTALYTASGWEIQE